MEATANKIAKEEVFNLLFSKEDVLKTEKEKQDRKEALSNAMVMGNSDKVKCRIIFETTAGTCEIDTTIWHVTDEHIDIKGGAFIPIKSIYKVIS